MQCHFIIIALTSESMPIGAIKFRIKFVAHAFGDLSPGRGGWFKS
jgi:hypothetical protein